MVLSNYSLFYGLHAVIIINRSFLLFSTEWINVFLSFVSLNRIDEVNICNYCFVFLWVM